MTKSPRIRLSPRERFIADIIAQSVCGLTFAEATATSNTLAPGIARAAKMLVLLETKL
jgi:hypothetical protein